MVANGSSSAELTRATTVPPRLAVIRGPLPGPAPASDVREPAEVDTGRERLSLLRSLLILSQLMMESENERQIAELAQTAIPALASIDHAAIKLANGSFVGSADARELLETPLATGDSGPINGISGYAWGRTYPLRHRRGDFGMLGVLAAREPDDDEQFMLSILAQQTGAALANVFMLRRERAAAQDLATMNEALEATVDDLQRSIDVHERLTAVAVSGQGRQGIVMAVHALTGLRVLIEDRHGNVRASAPDIEQPAKPEAGKLAALHRRLERRGRPLRDGGRLIALSRPRYDVMETISLIDPEEKAGEFETRTLEHAATILAMELARLHSLAETELRLRQDFLDDLVTGIDAESALRRAQALNYDIEQTHRVVVVQCDAVEGEMLLHATRRAVHSHRLGALLGLRERKVVVLANREITWEDFRVCIQKDVGNARCRVGIGTLCSSVEELPRSYRQAGLVLNLQDRLGDRDAALAYDDLGVFRLFAALEDVDEIQNFVDRWLGPLVAYDENRDADLVATLGCYLEHGSYDATAEALYIHRSTLKYRLQRIREIAGVDLNDPDTRFNLQLATRAHDVVGALSDCAPSRPPASS